MAQYKVLKQFRLLDDVNVPEIGPVYETGEIIDIKVKRADQVIKTLGESFLERIDKKDDEVVDEDNNQDDASEDETIEETEETPKEE